jgi:hypothetical protein
MEGLPAFRVSLSKFETGGGKIIFRGKYAYYAKDLKDFVYRISVL